MTNQPTTARTLVLVCTGAKTYSSYYTIRQVLDGLQDRVDRIYVGCAAGADSLVQHWARTRQLDIHVIEGSDVALRNEAMVRSATEYARDHSLEILGLVFWAEFETPGTLDALLRLEDARVPCQEYDLLK